MRSGSSKRGLIVQLKETSLAQSSDKDSRECLDVYAAAYVFSDPFPIIFTLIHRIDDLTAHIKL